jgi:hypothetical protein
MHLIAKEPTLTSRIAFYSAALAFALLIALTLAGGAATPDYSHISQFISEFGAHDAPHAQAFSWAGFFPVGVLVCVASAALWLALPHSRLVHLVLLAIAMFGISYIVSAIYPCDAGCQPAHPSRSQIIHNLVGLFAYVCLPPSLLAFAWQSRRWPDAKYPTLFALLAGVVASVSLVALFTADRGLGLVQRAMESAFFVWLIATSLYAMRPIYTNA